MRKKNKINKVYFLRSWYYLPLKVSPPEKLWYFSLIWFSLPTSLVLTLTLLLPLPFNRFSTFFNSFPIFLNIPSRISYHLTYITILLYTSPVVPFSYIPLLLSFSLFSPIALFLLLIPSQIPLSNLLHL